MILSKNGLIFSTELQEYEILNKTAYDLLPNGIFYKGYGLMEHPWFNDAKRTMVTDRETIVKFIAYKDNYGWKIYTSLDANFEQSDYLDGWKHLRTSWERIYAVGAKALKRHVQSLMTPIVITEEVLALYSNP